MTRKIRSRLFSNITIVCAAAAFCLAGFAVSRTVSSSNAAKSKTTTASTPVKKRTDLISKQSSIPLVSNGVPVSLPGELVFGSGSFGRFDLYIATELGSQNNIYNITNFNEHDPIFSPDGNKILFRSYRDDDLGSGVQELYSMKPDGYDQTRLTTGLGFAGAYAFSPDSSSIAFISNYDLWKMNANGSGATLLADFPGNIEEPQFSPDGTKIFFIYEGQIWQMNGDGSNPAALGNLGFANRARFSPDGTKIVFASNDEIYTINSDGSNEVMIIDDDVVSYSLDIPKYSPDGSKLLMECRGINPNSGVNICTSNADGTGFSPLAGTILERQSPVWSPDSSTIGFIARNPTTNEYGVYTAALGQQPELVYLEGNGAILHYLAWQPDCTALSTPTPTPSGTPIPGLISEWNANDSTANDSQGLNNGQFTDNAALINPGKRGLGFYFPGNGGYISVPDSNSLDVQTGDYTLSTWFYPIDPAEHYVAGKGACNGGGSNFYIGVNSSFDPFIDISHASGGSRLVSSGHTLSQNNWHSLLLKKEGTTYTLYIDGVLSIAHNESGTMDTSDQPFTLGKGIGCTPPQLTTNGGVDEVLLFGRALNTQEIDAIYNGYTPPIGPTPTPTPMGGLVGFWRANGDANDSAGSNNGVLEGDTAYASGHEGQAFDFDGSGDRVRVADNSSNVLDVQTGDFTVAAWVYIRSNGTHFIAGKEFDNGSYSLKVEGLKLYFYLLHDGIYSYINTGDDLTLNAWHHVAGVRSNGQIRVFVDGGERSSTGFTDLLVANDWDFTIGGPVYTTSPQPDTNGLIDDVRLYSRGLDETEMTAIYNDPGIVRRDDFSIRRNLVCQPHADPAVSIRVNYPNPVAGGRTANLMIRLRDFAPAGGTVVNLSYSDIGVVNGPATVTVPEGNNQVSFDVTSMIGNSFRYGDIIASLGADTARVTLTVAPAAPDVAVSNLVAPPVLDILQNYTATWTITNNGQAPTDNYRQDTFFISPDDQIFNGNDIIVGRSYDNAGVILPGQSKNMTFNEVNIPSSAIPADGNYFLIIYVGDAGTVRERGGNFFDNYISLPVQVHRNLPDLIAENIVVPAEVEPGVQFTISWDVRNVGTRATTTGFSVNAYMSFDTTVGGTDDIPITFRTSPILAINGVSSYSQQFSIQTVPARPSSDALIYFKIDEGNVVFEGNANEPAELNNTPSQPFRFEYRVPDLRVASVTSPIEVETDTAFDLNWTTKNFGNKTATAMNEKVYFSTDAVINANDVQIGSFQLAQQLAPDQTVDRIQTVLIPTNSITATGDHYIYVKTDADGAVDEGENEDNNVTFQQLRVRRLLRPDLQITNITGPPTAFFNQEIQVQWTISNNGAGPTNAPNWQDDLYVGVNQSLNGATRLATLSNVSFLNAGESYIASATVRIPRGISGAYYLITRTDGTNTVNEETENNNLTTRPITINVPPLPDLTASNVQAPEQGFGGQPILVSWTVTNSGDGASPSNEAIWYDVVYISRDNVLDGGDRTVGTRQHNGALAPTGSYTVSNLSVDLPGDAFGDYYVFVTTDAFGHLYEYTAEGNNSAYDQNAPGSPLHVFGTPPDLTVISPITAPSSELAGRPIAVPVIVRNQGAFDATGSWLDGLYLSTDANFDPLIDTQLGSIVHNGLPAGQQYVNNFAVTIPTCLNGTYFLIAVTDIAGQLFEYDPVINAEGNNVSSPKQIDIASFSPDLRITQVTVPPVVINGSMPMSWTVRNFGNAATTQTGWSDRVFLYNGQQLINLGYFDHQGALAINGEYTQNQVVQVPLFLEGDFQIIVRTDIFNFVPECAFDQNNEATGQTQVNQNLPDIQITAVNSPGSAALGSTFNVSWSGSNLGSAMTPPAAWADTVYLSTNTTYEFGDTPIGGSVTATALGAGQTYSSNVNVTIPSVTTGNYYLIVNGDNGNNVAEGTNEGNNGSPAIPIVLTAPQVDLQVTNITVAPVLYSGQFADISWTVANNGVDPTASTSWSDHVILSRDLVIDPSDRTIEFRPHSGVLNAGSSYTETRSVAIPTGLTGEYKIFVLTDRANYVVESNDANNSGTPQTVDLQLPPPAELNITNITAPPSITNGEVSIISWTVQNSSNNNINGVWQDSVYLSTDQTWDSGDVLVGQRPRNALVGAFATYTETLTSVLPPVELGSYFVIVRTDARNTIRESIETNNVTSSLGQSAVGVPNLTIGTPLITSLVTGQERYYSIFSTPPDETMLITLDGENGSRNELYSRGGSMVSRSNYELQGDRPGEPDQENSVFITTDPTYYSMIRGDYVPGSFAEELRKADKAKGFSAESLAPQQVTLKAEILPFVVRRVSPDTSGNKGIASLQIEGAKFQQGATVKLVGANNIQITPMQFAVGTSRIAAIFDLDKKPAGTYSIVVTNPNAQSATLADSFQIVNGGGYNMRTSIVAPTVSRGGLRTRTTFSVSNDGLNDALNVPIFIQIPAPYNYSLDSSVYREFPTSELSPDVDISQLPLHVDRDGVRTIMLYAPLLRSRSTTEIGVDFDIPFNYSAFPVSIQILKPMSELADALGSNFNGNPAGLVASSAMRTNDNPVNPNCWLELFRQVFFAVLNEVLPADCLKAGWLAISATADAASNLMLGAVTGGISTWGIVSAFASKFVSIASKSALCLGKQIPWIKMASIAVTLVQLLSQLDDCIGGPFKTVVLFRQPLSIDPNEKLGPEGYGAERFVGVQEPLQYRINFENLSTAEAPAQRIRIVDHLPSTLDPRTLRLTQIGFKQNRVQVPANRSYFQTRLQLGSDLGNLQAEISAGLDIVNGTVTWNMTAIDPSTNERPIDPLAGLLPPNNANRDGEGYVVFTIMPTTNQPTRTSVANLATIYFDENEPIVTNTTGNLLDADIPISQCTALPSVSESPTFDVAWSGSDDPNGSGLKGFDVYVSDNGGSYYPVSPNTTLTTSTFAGKFGHTYSFYSIAVDNADNREAPPATPDATTTVAGGAYESDVASRPNGNNDGTVDVQDVAQVRRFAAKLDTDFQYNEFQRADTSPLIDGGDGALSVADVMQASRFAVGTDDVRESFGPLIAGSPAGKSKTGNTAGLLPRSIYPLTLNRTANKIIIGVRLEAQGDETGVGFTLDYNTVHLANPANITLGPDAAGGVITSNIAQAGKVGIIVDKLPNQPFTAGGRLIATIEFDVVDLVAAATQITFSGDPVADQIVDGTASALTADFPNTIIPLVSPTAAGVTVAGRVTDAAGRPVPNTVINIADDAGTVRTALSNGFGYYKFEDVEAGRTYVVSARHKIIQFVRPSVIVNLDDALEALDFVGLP